jgi:hypothetical protein
MPAKGVPKEKGKEVKSHNDWRNRYPRANRRLDVPDENALWGISIRAWNIAFITVTLALALAGLLVMVLGA